MPSQSNYTLGQKKELHELTLPSGATCQAKRPGVQGLIAAGLLDSFDQLTALVQNEHIEPNSPKKIGEASKVTAADVAFAAKNAEQLHAALMLMDRLVVGVVTAPEVWIDYQMKDEPDDDWNKRQEAAVKSGAVPVRAIEDEDKMFLMQWAVGGSSDLEQFRQESQKLMADVDPSQAIQMLS